MPSLTHVPKRLEVPPPKSKSRRKSRRAVIISLISCVFALYAVAALVTVLMYNSNFGRAEPSMYSTSLRYSDITGYNRTQVSFMSGDNKLVGYIYGEENDKGLVVIAHGIGSSAEGYLPETIYFVDQGWRVFIYDCTGSWNSEGKGTKGLPQSALDLDVALTYIESQNWNLPVMLYGHSWGGYAVTAVLNYEHAVTASVSVAGYDSPIVMLHEQAGYMLGWVSVFAYPIEWSYQRILFGSAAGLTAVDGINRSGIPVMIIHGTADETIRYDGAAIIAQKDQITNPNVEYKTCSMEGQNGHNSLVMSEVAVKYTEELNAEYNAISEYYGGEVPEEVKTAFSAAADRFQASELDGAFMDEVNAFFEKQISW